ncbi:MAG: sigma-70 family RNA polymerase sigma factor [Bacteroidota bacterium]
MQESDIIRDCQRQKPKAQQQLYELYLPYVLGICRRFNVPRLEIKDLIQEVFIEVFLNIKSFESERGAFKNWLKIIAIRKLIKVIRHHKMEFQPLTNLENEDSIAEQIELDKLNADYLIHLIADLPRGYRTVFNLFIIDGYSHQEISEMLEISVSTSRSQLVRARQLLQQKIFKMQEHGVI